MMTHRLSLLNPLSSEADLIAPAKNGGGLIAHAQRKAAVVPNTLPTRQPIARQKSSHARGLISTTRKASCRCRKPWACTCEIPIPHAHFGGLVKAPPGPPDRDTGVLRIPMDGYVLPTETVRALGGAQVLDTLVEKTTGQRPTVLRAMAAPRGLIGRVPGYDDGGSLGAQSDAGPSLLQQGWNALVNNSTTVIPFVAGLVDGPETALAAQVALALHKSNTDGSDLGKALTGTVQPLTVAKSVTQWLQRQYNKP